MTFYIELDGVIIPNEYNDNIMYVKHYYWLGEYSVVDESSLFSSRILFNLSKEDLLHLRLLGVTVHRLVFQTQMLELYNLKTKFTSINILGYKRL